MKASQPTLVALSAVTWREKIVLIKRNKPPYAGLWGLPGGKIRTREQVKQAALRETREEIGIDCDFEHIRGIASEIAYENGKFKHHFIIFVCELRPKSFRLRKSREGIVDWFSLKELYKIKDRMIPSDYLMIETFVMGKRKKEYPVYEIEVSSTSKGHYVKGFFR